MENLPPVYRKIFELIQDMPTDRKATIESEVVRRFRLNKDDCHKIIKGFEKQGLLKGNKFTIKI